MKALDGTLKDIAKGPFKENELLQELERKGKPLKVFVEELPQKLSAKAVTK